MAVRVAEGPVVCDAHEVRVRHVDSRGKILHPAAGPRHTTTLRPAGFCMRVGWSWLFAQSSAWQQFARWALNQFALRSSPDLSDAKYYCMFSTWLCTYEQCDKLKYLPLCCFTVCTPVSWWKHRTLRWIAFQTDPCPAPAPCIYSVSCSSF